MKPSGSVAYSFFIFLALNSFGGCAKIGDSDWRGPANEVQNPVLASPPTALGWERHEQVSPDGTVELTHRDMPAAERAKVREEYHQTTLIQVPSDPAFNVSLFRIKNVPEWDTTVFIAPRIYAYGSAEGGRVAPQRHNDHSVSVSFPVVLADGIEPTIAAPGGTRQINLPSSFVIQDLARLRATLAARFGPATQLATLPGCPKQFLLKINAQEIDVTPSDLARGDYCQANKPLNITVRLPEDDARYMLEQALYKGAVEVRAVYETRASFVDSQVSISFDKQKLFRSIEAELQVRAGAWADVDARAKVSQVVKSEAMTINIVGDPGPVVDSIVEQAIHEFFTPFTPDPATGLKECSNAVVCLRLNYNYDRQQQSFTFSWNHTSTTQTGQNYLTWTQLSPLLDKVVAIGGGIRADGQPKPELSNHDANGYETGLTVVPGDLLEITPSYLIQEERAFNIPHTERAHNNVCVLALPAHDQRVCQHSCHHGECDTDCWNERVPEKCLNSEDHWVDTTTYSYSSPTYPRIDQPVGQFQRLFDGLALRFVWRVPNEPVVHDITCPLNQFSREGDGKSLVVRLENRGDSCRFFSADPAIQPMLYLVNQLSEPIAFKQGREVLTWDGRTLERPSASLYYPERKFAGTVAIRGYSFSGNGAHLHDLR